MKKALSLTALTLASLLAMTGCANPVDDANGSASDAPAVQAPRYKADPDIVAMLPKDLQDGGALKVGVNPDVPPIKYTDSAGKMTGVAPQLVEAAASMMGLTAEMELTTFDALIPGLESGESMWSPRSAISRNAKPKPTSSTTSTQGPPSSLPRATRSTLRP